MAAGNGAGFALPASALVRGGGQGAGHFGEPRRGRWGWFFKVP